MRYQFLEIRFDKARRMEVAYLLDTQSGRVLKSPVTDFIGEDENDFEVEVDDRNNRKTLEWNPPLKKIKRNPRPQDILEEDDEEELAPPAPKQRLVIPPALQGVFMTADTPGAAVETRRI